MLEALVDAVTRAGHSPVILGSRVVVVPAWGRVVGLFPDGRQNALWVNEPLFGADDSSWINYGGDRVWISPELDTNVADVGGGRLDVVVRKSVDPGSFQLTQADAGICEIVSRDSVSFRRADSAVDLIRRRVVEVLSDAPHTASPHTASPHGVSPWAGVTSAGYRSTTTLTAEGSVPEKVRPAVWSILQVKPGSEITVPTLSHTPRTLAFIGAPRFDVAPRGSGGLLTCAVDASSSWKIGLHASDSLGLAMAEHDSPAGRVLVVRTSAVTPAERCSDVPGTLASDDPRAAGYVQQLYVDDGALGGFGELEHHSPYLSSDNGYRVTDVCETFAYCGPADAVAAVRERWLASARSRA